MLPKHHWDVSVDFFCHVPNFPSEAVRNLWGCQFLRLFKCCTSHADVFFSPVKQHIFPLQNVGHKKPMNNPVILGARHIIRAYG